MKEMHPFNVTLLFLSAIFLLLLFWAAVPWCPKTCYGMGIKDKTLGQGCGLWGNYGFVSAGFSDALLLQNVTRLVQDYHVTDVQFYDWFPNYSGIFQAFPPTRAAPVSPSWFHDATSWSTPWNGERTVEAAVLKGAIDVVNKNSARPWAYVQSQTSEFLTLAGAGTPNRPLAPDQPQGIKAADFDAACLKLSASDKNTYVDISKIFKQPSDSIDKLMNSCLSGTGSCWICQPQTASNPQADRIIPGYFLNAALARYQCYAWGEAVHALGFFGIHWDTMITVSDKQAQINGALEFVREAQTLLWHDYTLHQTFNDIKMDFGIVQTPELFPGVLHFPYAELWDDPETESRNYAALVAQHGYQGAVVNLYPGGKEGCPYECADLTGNSFLSSCCITPDSCKSTPKTADCDTYHDLALKRYTTFGYFKMRYNLVGCGRNKDGTSDASVIGSIFNEYFPNIVPFDAASQDLQDHIKACLFDAKSKKSG